MKQLALSGTKGDIREGTAVDLGYRRQVECKLHRALMIEIVKLGP